jgi:hypothetical protein
VKSFAALYAELEETTKTGVRWLREHGVQAQAVASRWEGESDEADMVVAEEGSEPDVNG